MERFVFFEVEIGLRLIVVFECIGGRVKVERESKVGGAILDCRKQLDNIELKGVG